MATQAPRPTLLAEAGRTYKASPSSDARLSPQVRATPLETAIPAIGLDAIQGFLVQNRVVEPEALDAAPYVVEGESDRLVLGGGDRLYVRGALPESQAYNFVRKGSLYVDPVTNEVLGQEATYIGLGRVVAQGETVTDDAARSALASRHAAFAPFSSLDEFYFWALDDRRLTLEQIVRYLIRTLELHRS